MRSPFLLLGSLALLLSACAANRFSSERALEPSAAYRDAVYKASRHKEHTENLAVHMQVYATLLSPAFLDAYREEYTGAYGAAVSDPTLQPKQLTVVLALEANHKQLANLAAFDGPRKRLWTLTYGDGTTAVTASRVTPFDREDMYFRYFFPYWTPWQQIYRVEFPLPPAATGTLQMQGVGGTVRLTW